ncbi:MAG: CinA family nicotinamide mononucleotide deamidase-related protein [Planctomycetes bacterium]|nr:CinA family nicotinamide mononucleotide deamidase-related protein [Planctomycetota bacterium]
MLGEVRSAACIAVGDELLAGDYPDSNSGAIARGLAELGIVVERFVVLGDRKDELESAIYELCARYQLVVCTGGIGPTLDDVTREAAAAAAGVALERNEAVLAELRASYARRACAMPESNERQAWFPRGAQVMPNAVGTAPGFRVWIDGGTLCVLPGPSHEMQDMLRRELLPWLRSTCGQGPGIVRHSFYLLGLPESAFSDRAGEWMARGATPLLGVTAHTGILKVTLLGKGESVEGARAQIAARAAELRARFAEEIYSEDDPRPGAAIVRQLSERGATLAVAESCTGGLVSELLTEVPGASGVFVAGWVSYSNASKVRALGVDPALLERHGAVSREVALALAQGAAERSGADFAVSITGVAGPSGGTPEKPVGLVWFGLWREGRLEAFERRFPPVDRASIRRYAAHTALNLVRLASR